MTIQHKSFSPDCQLAIEAAQKAGAAILGVYAKDFSVQEKAEQEPVTVADLESDAIIRKILATTGYPILSEETADTDDRLQANKIWIVDPLDGTKDFINHTGEFSVMIGLVEDQQPIIGVIYQPTTETLYVAEHGQGAYEIQNGRVQRLQVTPVADLRVAKPILSVNHLTAAEKNFFETLHCKPYQQKGSLGLKAAVICAGAADFYFTMSSKINQWDSAAALCLINEAGGRMTDLKGGELYYNIAQLNHESGLLVSNGRLHQQLLAAYKKV